MTDRWSGLGEADKNSGWDDDGGRLNSLRRPCEKSKALLKYATWSYMKSSQACSDHINDEVLNFVSRTRRSSSSTMSVT